MLLKNAEVYHTDFTFHKADILMEDGEIKSVAPSLPGTGEDLGGLRVIPGLLDIHSHGCVGCDWSRGGEDNYYKMARYYAENGVTSLLATTMSLPADTLDSIMHELRAFIAAPRKGAKVLGINMEGPFFSKEKKGAQNEANLIDPDAGLFRRLQEASGNHILLCDIAPELPGAEEFIKALKDEVRISLAHTAAGYDTAMHAVSLGARHATHLYNAMTPFTHRSPGVVGAVFDSDIDAEMISDGIHLDPAVVRITFKVLGPGRIALISDSMEACGMPNGMYELGGQAVTVKDGLATIASGSIAGSATNQFECMRRAIRFGVREEDAIRAATHSPARMIGMQDRVGVIAPGAVADLVVVDRDYDIKAVYTAGERLA
ncbi:N-acetylglucosamine-6-phosphate deacetylase [Harryflintia acetispora]|uniref:N-acetylglucosamine-6-phosphate deacetylase n=1 Tax=Harryflintia acetispora TaxID=1849041 RepID=A0A9X8UIK6_9FIRM|nr:N-acetylglucosamine-6-phosphate deacetylase [Harryflintia acetispora]TCL42610.1 N-acetylglucosamine-6-phosphate deacetylase [Harryflintia acetispora]